MSGVKYDSISNYNLSYENLLEAAEEMNGFIIGLSKNDLFLFLDNEDQIADFIKNQSSISKESEEDKSIRKSLMNFLDRTTGTYFLKDYIDKERESLYPSLQGFKKDADLSKYIQIVGPNPKSGTGTLNGILSSFIYDENGNAYTMKQVISTYQSRYGESPVLDKNGEQVEDKDGFKKTYISSSGVDESFTLNSSKFVAPEGLIEPSKDGEIGLSAIVVKKPNLGVLAKSASHLPVFFNGIPPLEMSRCVPYIDIKILSQNFARDENNNPIANSNKMNFHKYFKFEQSKNDNSFQAFYDLKDNFTTELSQTTDPAIDNLQQSFMDVFTSPQTFSNANISRAANNKKIETRIGSFNVAQGKSNSDPILEPIMPMMTLQSLTVRITSAGAGIMSSKSADLNIVLHDRSRLKEIAPLVSPNKFATTKIEIEYGWNHPEGGVASDNVIGRYLSSLKEKSVFQVIGSDYKFSDGGEVNISIKLAAYGFRNNQRVHVGAGPVVPLNSVRDIIDSAASDIISENYNDFKDKSDDVPDLRQKIKTVARNARSSNSSLSWETYRKVIQKTKEDKEEFLRMLKILFSNKVELAIDDNENKLSPEDKKLYDEIKNSGILDLENNNETLLKKTYDKLNTLKIPDHPDPFILSLVEGSTVEKDLKEFLFKNDVGVDPVLLKDFFYDTANVFELSSDDGAIYTEDYVYVTLGKVISSFIGNAIASTNLYDEVQLVFYPLNHHAGGARVHTTASFPFPIEKLEKLVTNEISKNSQLTMSRFFSLLEREILSDKNLSVYGFSGLSFKEERKKLKEVKEFGDKFKILSSLYKDKNLAGLGLNEKDDIDKVVIDAFKRKSGAETNIKNAASSNLSSINKDREENKFTKDSLASKTKNRISAIYSEYVSYVSEQYSSQITKKCAEMYSNDGLDISTEAKFVRPNFSMDFEVIPVIDTNSVVQSLDGFSGWVERYINNNRGEQSNGLKLNKSIMRIHIYDEEAVQSPSEHTLLNNLISGNSSTIVKQSETEGFNFFGNDGVIDNLSFWDVKQIVKRAYPTINYGSAGSTVKSIGVSSNTAGDMANVLMVESYGNLKNGQIRGHNFENTFDSATMFPNSITLNMVGMPMIGRGSSIFVDFNTNTSLDNIYTVKSVTHNISAGKFDTALDLVPSNIGSISNFKEDIVRKVEALAKK